MTLDAKIGTAVEAYKAMCAAAYANGTEEAFLDLAEKMTDAERVELDRQITAWLDAR